MDIERKTARLTFLEYLKRREWIPSLLMGAFFAALAIADWFAWNPSGRFAEWARVVFVCAILIFLVVENGWLKSRIGVLEKEIADLRARPPS